MSKKDLILIGGGGHCKSVIDVVEELGTFNIVGIIDTFSRIGQKLFNYDIVGSDEDLPKLSERIKNFFICVGQIKSCDKRYMIYETLKKLDVQLPIIVSPYSHVSKYATINEGTIVMHNAFVNAGANIGPNCIINTGCIIEHDVHINAHSHISTGTVINGEVTIGIGTFVGSNSVIIQGVQIGNFNVIGAGSVININTDHNSSYVGNPGRKLQKKI